MQLVHYWIKSTSQYVLYEHEESVIEHNKCLASLTNVCWWQLNILLDIKTFPTILPVISYASLISGQHKIMLPTQSNIGVMHLWLVKPTADIWTAEVIC